jgi:hypothetical protein
MTKKQIIDEISSIYINDPSKRAYSSSHGCQYLTEDGRMCAVGQCLLEPENMLFGGISVRVEQEEGLFGVTKISSWLDSKLKPEYRGHDVMFWQNLQDFHDFNHHWRGNTITEDGKNHLQTLYDKYAPEEYVTVN